MECHYHIKIKIFDINENFVTVAFFACFVANSWDKWNKKLTLLIRAHHKWQTSAWLQTVILRIYADNEKNPSQRFGICFILAMPWDCRRFIPVCCQAGAFC